MTGSPENTKAIEVQKCFASPSGKVLYGVLRKFIRPDEVLRPVDSMGRIDSMAVQYNEGKRAVWCHINALINKNVNEIKQKKAEV